MKNHLFVFVLFTVFSIFSCTNETEEITTLESNESTSITTDQRGGNRNNPQNSNDATTVTQWMDLFLELDRYAEGMRPNATARALAYMNLAAYETAAPGLPNFRSNTELLNDFSLEVTSDLDDINWQIALNATMADVMQHFMLNVPDGYMLKIDQLEATLATSLSENESSITVENSKAWGASVASQVIEYSQTDAEAEAQILEPQPLSYEPPTGDGYWTYSAEEERALFPYWGKVRTFIISPEQTRSIPPIDYSEDENSRYFRQMQEVYEANNTAREEDNEQLWIAEFWSDDVTNLTFSPPGRQISIANQLIDQYDLDLDEALHLYLKLSFSLNDAAVATWKYKYQYMVMRPNVFIHEFIDPNFQTNLYSLIPWPNPTFPGYPSGHSCFASAAGGVFIDFVGNRGNFTDRSHEGREEFRSTPRRFRSIEEMAEENAYSRIPLGVHIRMDCTEGLRLGYEIADAVNRYDLRRRGA
ncbi:MAG: vanadium-dependent haloperoxidase [Bacteroidota bacterium]